MKGMLPGIAALVAGLGCGRTLLPLDGVGMDPGGLSLVPLGASSAGVVEDNTAGIVGQWYAYGDGWGIDGPDGPCETNGHFPMSECSSILFPPPGSFFPQATPGTFCLWGTAAKVVDGDYADIYGIGLSLDLNNSGGVKMPYDAPQYGVIGFQFDIENMSTAPMAVRVEFPTRETIQNGFVFWGKLLTTPLPNDGKNIRVLFQDVKQLFDAGAEPPPFVPADVQSIQFHVPSVAGNSIPVEGLCVSNLRAIVEN